MFDDTALTHFHFLRPAWLLLIPWAIWTHLRLRRRYQAALQWREAIAPHLLAHLTVAGRSLTRLRPYQLLTVASIVGALAAAGPSWQRQITPFTEDTAPLVVALKLTPSMLATDTQPSRLERAKQKLRDLLVIRKGAATAVIVYAGTAHLVLPLTDDVELIEAYLESLKPSIMPVAGDNPMAVFPRARAALESEPTPGTILFLTDGIDVSLAPAFAAARRDGGDQILLLTVGTSAGGPADPAIDPETLARADAIPGADTKGLSAVGEAVGNAPVSVRLDDRDLEQIRGRMRSHLVDTIAADEALQWRDAGYPLVWVLAFLMLFWFRKGWTIQWA